MRLGSEAVEQLQRALAGMAVHPNVGACVFVGLGCESNLVHELIRAMELGGWERSNWKAPLFLALRFRKIMA